MRREKLTIALGKILGRYGVVLWRGKLNRLLWLELLGRLC